EPDRCSARRALRRLCLRQLRTACAVAGGGLLLLDRVVCTGNSQATPGELAGALSLDRSRRAALLSKSRGPGPPRRRVRPGGHPGAIPHPCATGARPADPAIQAQCAVADE